MFASNLPDRDRKPKYISKFKNKPLRRWQSMAPHPIPLPCASALPSPAIWPKNASCSRIPPRASRAWATTCNQLSPLPCPAPLSCSLQLLLELSLLSLRPSLLQFVTIVSLLLNHGNQIFQLVCVFLHFSLLPLLFWSKWNSALSPCLQFGRYHHSDSTITFSLV